MAKFKVGDRVKAIKSKSGNEKIVGKSGTIIASYALHERYAVVFDENVDGHNLMGLCEDYHGWWCHESDLVKVGDCNEKIVITSDGETTTAKMYNGENVIKTASAKCSPEDTFNFETGAKIAFDRLTEKPLLNTKFCVYEGDGTFKTGHIYDVVDGDIIHPDGYRLPHDFRFHTIKELYDYCRPLKIVEVVEDR